jgi:hypothetical protein
MIEANMARRIALRAAALAPILAGGLWLAGGGRWAVSGLVGLALTVANLWMAGRILGGIAESNPNLLLPVGVAVFAFGFILLAGVALALKAADAIFFPVTGFVLVGSHLGLVLWEAAGAYARPEVKRRELGSVAR